MKSAEFMKTTNNLSGKTYNQELKDYFLNTLIQEVGNKFHLYIDTDECKAFIGNEDNIKCTASILWLGDIITQDIDLPKNTRRWIWPWSTKIYAKDNTLFTIKLNDVPSCKQYVSKNDGIYRGNDNDIYNIEQQLYKDLGIVFILKDMIPFKKSTKSSGFKKQGYRIYGLKYPEWKDLIWKAPIVDDDTDLRRIVDYSKKLDNIKNPKNKQSEVNINADLNDMKQFYTDNTNFLKKIQLLALKSAEVYISESGKDFSIYYREILNPTKTYENIRFSESEASLNQPNSDSESFEKDDSFENPETFDSTDVKKNNLHIETIMMADCTFLASLSNIPNSDRWIWIWAWYLSGTEDNPKNSEETGTTHEIGLDKKRLINSKDIQLRSIIDYDAMAINTKSIKALQMLLKKELGYEHVYQYDIDYEDEGQIKKMICIYGLNNMQWVDNIKPVKSTKAKLFKPTKKYDGQDEELILEEDPISDPVLDSSE